MSTILGCPHDTLRTKYGQRVKAEVHLTVETVTAVIKSELYGNETMIGLL